MGKVQKPIENVVFMFDELPNVINFFWNTYMLAHLKEKSIIKEKGMQFIILK